MNNIKRTALAVMLAVVWTQASAENLSPNLKFNGFATASAGVVNKDQGGEYLQGSKDQYLGLTEDPNYTLESVVGLQFDYKINDKTNIVAQLVAQGSSYFDVNAEWAYISYQFNDNLKGRAGHLGMPIFMYSDSLYVGQSYPWVRLPSELYYAIPTTSFSGADLLYRQPLGDAWNFDAQLYTGASNTETFYTEDSVGLNLTLSNEDLLLRMGYTNSKLTSTQASLKGTSLDVADAKITFGNAGFIFDNGAWFLAGEFGQLTTEGWLQNWNAGFLSAGHYFGKWLPYVLASTTHSFDEQDCLSVAGCVVNIPGVTATTDLVASSYLDQSTYAIGAKYAVSSNLSVKMQLDKVIPANGSNGFVGYNDDPTTQPVSIPGVGTLPDDESNQAHLPSSFYVFTLALTAAF